MVSKKLMVAAVLVAFATASLGLSHQSTVSAASKGKSSPTGRPGAKKYSLKGKSGGKATGKVQGGSGKTGSSGGTGAKTGGTKSGGTMSGGAKR